MNINNSWIMTAILDEIAKLSLEEKILLVKGFGMK